MRDNKHKETAKYIIRRFGNWWTYPDNIEKAVIILLEKGLSNKEIKELLSLILVDIRNEYGD